MLLLSSHYRCCLIVFVLVLSICSPFAFAAKARTVFIDYRDIALADALQDSARQFGVAILYDATLIPQTSSVSIRGNFTLQPLMAQLLQGTGLQVKVTAQNYLLIVPEEVEEDLLEGSSVAAPPNEDDSFKSIPVITITARNHTTSIANATLSSTKSKLTLLELPQSVEYFDLAFMDDRNVLDIAELYRDISGFYLHDNESQSSLRGFSTSVKDYLTDGAPPVLDLLMPIPLGNIERVEVLKGANSLFYGSGGPSGVVNLVRKQPDWQGSARVDVSYSNERAMFNADVSPDSNSEAFSQRYNFYYSQDGSYYVGDDLTFFAFSPSWRFASQGSTWVLRFDYAQKDFDGGVATYRAKDIDRLDLYLGNGAKPDNFSNAKIYDFSGHYERELNNHWQLQGRFALGRGQRESRYHNEFAFPDLADLYDQKQPRFYQYLALNEQRSSRVYGDMTVLGDLFWGEQRHQLTLGMKINYSSYDITENFGYNQEIFDAGQGLSAFGKTSGNQDLINAGDVLKIVSQLSWYNPDSGDYELGIRPPNAYSTVGLSEERLYPFDSVLPIRELDLDSMDAGVYCQDVLRLGSRWHVLMGVGYYQYREQEKRVSLDVFDITTVDGRSGTAPVLNPVPTSADQVAANNNHVLAQSRYTVEGDKVIPKLGVSYLVSPTLSFYSSYAEQYDIVSGVDSTTGGDFDPAHSRNVEVGAKYLVKDDFSINLSRFRVDSDNYLVQRDVSTSFRYQDGEFEVDGIEAHLKGYVTPHFKASAQYAHLDIRLNNQGTEEPWLPNYAPNSGSLWLQYHIEPYGLGGWSFSLGHTYSSDKQGVHEVPGFRLYDLALLYRAAQFSVALNIDNLTDEDWLIGGLSEIRYSLGYGRRARLSASIDF